MFLIGFVVYWIVDFLEGTRGERLFRSVVLILIVGFLILNLLVKRFDFARLQFLYNGFLIFVLIIAVTAFQPEIRRALIRIGRPSLRTSSSQKTKKTTDQIIDAVTRLSAAKIGAIIVIEKQVALGEFIETGVWLDSEVSTELLRTIFYPDTVLHDMAVVIRGDRIVAAGVQLPLAEEGQHRWRRAGFTTPGCNRDNQRFGCDMPGGKRRDRHYFDSGRRQANQKHRPNPIKTISSHPGRREAIVFQEVLADSGRKRGKASAKKIIRGR